MVCSRPRDAGEGTGFALETYREVGIASGAETLRTDESRAVHHHVVAGPLSPRPAPAGWSLRCKSGPTGPDLVRLPSTRRCAAVRAEGRLFFSTGRGLPIYITIAVSDSGSKLKRTLFHRPDCRCRKLVLWLAVFAGLVVEAEVSSARVQELFEMPLEELAQMEITPINVLGSHTHLQGAWMVGYRYMFMNMGGDNLDGTRKVSIDEVLQQYPVAHTAMTRETHMFEAMYAPSDYWTLMAMGQYKENWMDHQRRDGSTYTTESAGFGDTSVMALYTALGNPREKGHRLVLNAGLSIPTGSIEARDETDGEVEEYALQLGSGTFDLLPGLTYLGETENWSWGAQAMGTLRLGENNRDYRLGNGYRVSTWGYYKVTDWFGPSARLDWQAWDDISGADPELDPTTNPAFDADLQAGSRLDFLLGLNLYAPRGFLKGNRLSIEGGIPLYQSLDGPTMKTEWMITVGWSYTFH